MDSARDAAVVLGRRALALAKAAEERGIDTMPVALQRWAVRREAAEDGSAIVQAYLVADQTELQHLLIAEVREALRSSNEMTRFVAALESDATAAPVLGKVLFFAGMGLPLSPESIADAFLTEVLSVNERDRSDDGVASAWDDTRAAWTGARSFKSHVVAQLDGFKTTQPIELGGGLVIDQLTDEDIARGLQVGGIRAPFGIRIPLWIPSSWCLRLGFDEAAVVGDSGDTTGFESFAARRTEGIARMEEVVHALRLFKGEGTVTLPPAFGYSAAGGEWRSPFLGQLVQTFGFSGGLGRIGALYELEPAEGREFQRFYKDVVAARERSKPLNVAMRRFGYAGERHRADDRLTDLVIAAEAQLLDDSEKGEKSFQVSLRMAFSVDMAGTSRRDVFRFMRRAYGVRSAIVHGEEPHAKYLLGLDGGATDLGGFANDAERVLRALLRQAVVQSAEPASSKDWEERLFRDDETGEARPLI